MRGGRKLRLYGISTVTLKKRLFADAEERPRRSAIARRFQPPPPQTPPSAHSQELQFAFDCVVIFLAV